MLGEIRSTVNSGAFAELTAKLRRPRLGAISF
jgi:hypothetical protein